MQDWEKSNQEVYDEIMHSRTKGSKNKNHKYTSVGPDGRYFYGDKNANIAARVKLRNLAKRKQQSAQKNHRYNNPDNGTYVARFVNDGKILKLEDGMGKDTLRWYNNAKKYDPKLKKSDYQFSYKRINTKYGNGWY